MTYTLKVLVNNTWIVSGKGLTHAEAMEESIEFDRFIIEED